MGYLNFRLITLIAVLFVSVLMISNIVSTKLVTLWGFTFDGGTILFPLAYIIGDILTEVYGFKNARKVIWMGFLAVLLMSVTILIVGVLPAASDWVFQEDYNNILANTPRIVLASLIAYLVGEFMNSFVLSKIKVAMKGKMLPLRTIVSTFVGQGLDTVIFVLVAFYGVFPNEIIITIIVANYIIKVGIEVLFTPITLLCVNKIKKIEGVDVYDKKGDYKIV